MPTNDPVSPGDVSSSTDAAVSSPSSPALAMGDAFRASYEKLEPEMRGLDESEVALVTASVPNGVAMVLGVLARLMELRDSAAKLPDYDVTCFDRLPDCTRALAYAHASTLAPASVPRVDIVELGASAVMMREKINEDLNHLARHRFFDLRRLAPIKNLVGYKNVAFDLMALAKILREAWPSISGKTLLTEEDIARTLQLAEQLLAAVGERDQGASISNDATQMRQRAFTLFTRTYDQVRRAATFLLWDDPEQLAATCPSLYAGRRGGKRASKDETDDEATPDVQPVAPPIAGGKAADGSGQAASGVVHGGVIPGQPGGSPFLS